MKIERLELANVDVKNLDEAVKRFSDILGLTFVNAPIVKGEEKTITEHADRAFEKTKLKKVAMDRRGFLALIESDPPVEKEGLRNIHFKVPNLEEAKAEMKRKGVRLLTEFKAGRLKNAIFHPDDVHGIRLCLHEYEAPTPVDAMLQE